MSCTAYNNMFGMPVIKYSQQKPFHIILPSLKNKSVERINRFYLRSYTGIAYYIWTHNF